MISEAQTFAANGRTLFTSAGEAGCGPLHRWLRGRVPLDDRSHMGSMPNVARHRPRRLSWDGARRPAFIHERQQLGDRHRHAAGGDGHLRELLSSTRRPARR